MEDMKSVGIVGRTIIAALCAVPVQFVFFLLVLVFLNITGYFFPALLSFDWASSLGMPGEVLRFLEIWGLGILIYIVNLVCYIVFATVIEVKLRYELLCTLVIAFIVLAISASRARGGWINLGFEQFFADAFFTSMILFAVFSLCSVLLDEFTAVREWVQILLSAVLALTLGSVLAFLLWTVLR